MGHVDEGRRQTLVQLLDLDAHVRPQLGIKRRERLVEEKHRRVAHDRPSQCNPLALASRELMRLAVEELLDPQQRGRIANPLVDLAAGHLGHLQGKGNIPVDRHVRIERDALKDHRNVALVGRQMLHGLAIEENTTGRQPVETGDHVQSRCLAAAGRPQQNNELLILDIQGEVVDRYGLAESLDDVVYRDGSHDEPPLENPFTRTRRYRESGRFAHVYFLYSLSHSLRMNATISLGDFEPLMSMSCSRVCCMTTSHSWNQGAFSRSGAIARLRPSNSHP